MLCIVLKQMDNRLPSLEVLLQLFWLAAASACFIAMLPVTFMAHFRSAVLACCRRGKLVDKATNAKFAVPHSFFTHFYIVAVIWNTFLLVIAGAFICLCTSNVSSRTFQLSTLHQQISGAGSSHLILPESSVLSLICSGWASRIFFLHLLMEIHVMRRLYESLFILKSNPYSKMHIIGYLFGILYYIAAPLSLCCQNFWTMFCSIMQIFNQSSRKKGILSQQILLVAAKGFQWDCGNFFIGLGWWQWIGALVYFWGSVHQYHCHVILASLRTPKILVDKGNNSHRSMRTSMYSIPVGDWFEVVSCAHYLAEIVIYVGIFIASGGTDLTVFLLLSWVVLNLTLAGLEIHEWYLSKFDNYPKRWAIFPFTC